MNRATSTCRDEGATFDELTTALKETLNRRGALQKIRSSLRAEAFTALQLAVESNAAEEEEEEESGVSGGRLPLRPENVLIDELIRDYLEFNGYRGTASVLEVEAGIASNGSGGEDQESGLCREIMKLDLGVIENDNDTKGKTIKTPLLYGITEALKRRKNGHM